MYFSAEDRGEMMSMVYNWPAEQVSCFYQLCI
jgi:malate dehydrogenase (decarboxylating)